MSVSRLFRIFAIPLVAALGACASATEPFVEDPQFLGNLGRIDKPKEKPRKGFYVCYNTASTTPEEVYKLAVDYCAEVGKQVRFLYQQAYQCRLMVPARAYYYCFDSDDEERARREAMQQAGMMEKADRRALDQPFTRDLSGPNLAPNPYQPR